MALTVALHKRSGFFERWETRCYELGIQTCVLNGYDTGVIEKLKSCQALLWHLSQDSVHELTFARSILFAAEKLGLHVYPNVATSIHFDDKVAQKYLLEAVGAPLAPTWVFFEKEKALEWAAKANYPKVFKLRRGAGSSNVRLVRSRSEAIKLVNRMFGRGISPIVSARDKFKKGISKRGSRDSFSKLMWKLPRYVRAHMRTKTGLGCERDYVYFQEFIPEALNDTRVTIIGDRAFLFKRKVRPGDFRASGSGLIEYPEPDDRDMEAIRTAFDISKKLQFQTMAYDFVMDRKAQHLYLVEISYVFKADAVHSCSGFFDCNLRWHEGHTWPEAAVIEDLLETLR